MVRQEGNGHSMVCLCCCRFNLRVLECRVAAMLLAHLLPPAAAGAKALDWQQVTVLKQVEQHLMQHAAASGNSSAGAAELLVCAVQQLLPEATYTLQQVRGTFSSVCLLYASSGGCSRWLHDQLVLRPGYLAEACDQPAGM